MANIDDILTRLMRDPDFLQTHTEFLRAMVNNARETLKKVSEETCSQMRSGVQCQLVSGHDGPHRVEIVWSGNAGDYCHGTARENDDS